MMMYLGGFLFMMIFILIAPRSRAFLASLVLGLTTFMSAWAPYSYVLVLILLGALFTGVYIVRSWPKRVDPENPMAKYLRDAKVPSEEE